MDRFIAQRNLLIRAGYKTLKSNMDRFIGQSQQILTEGLKVFKIQYG